MADLPFAFWLAMAGVLGLIVGSFLNVVMLRLPARMEYFWKRDAREMLEHVGRAGAMKPNAFGRTLVGLREEPLSPTYAALVRRDG